MRIASIALALALAAVGGQAVCQEIGGGGSAAPYAVAPGLFDAARPDLGLRPAPGTQTFTVFAPTDAAFAALPAGTVEDLLKPENKDKLVAVLTYHVVPGKVMSTDLTEGMTAATVQGANVTITLDGGAKVNGAVISSPDVEASNGVIHVIDSVILPPEG